MANNKRLLLVVLLLVLTFVAFCRSLSHPFIIVDDISYIVENPHVMQGLGVKTIAWAFTSFQTAEWQPLTWLSLAATAHFFKANPFWYHLTNVLFHVANTGLLFLFLRLATGSFWRSLIVAALFGLHPLRVESVCWAAERKDVQSVFFCCLTLLAYLWYTKKQTWGRFTAVAASFSLGLLTKPMLVTLPCVLLLLDYWPLGRLRRDRFRVLWEKLPLFALSAFSAAMTIRAALEVSWVSLAKLPFFWRMANACVAYVLYMEKMLLPVNLAMFYPHPGASLALWKFALSLALLAAITAAAIKWARSRPYFFVGWFWYLGMLAPVAGLTQQSMADRFTYLPLTGLCMALVWGLGDWMQRRGVPARKAQAPVVLLVLALVAKTWAQAGLWRDSITLLSHTVSVTQGNYIAHASLSKALLDKGESREAFRHYALAASLNPGYMVDWLNDGANTLLDKGCPDKAIINLVMAQEIIPAHAPTLNKWGVALVMQGKYDAARTRFLESLGADPFYRFAAENLQTLDSMRAQPSLGRKGCTFSFAK